MPNPSNIDDKPINNDKDNKDVKENNEEKMENTLSPATNLLSDAKPVALPRQNRKRKRNDESFSDTGNDNDVSTDCYTDYPSPSKRRKLTVKTGIDEKTVASSSASNAIETFSRDLIGLMTLLKQQDLQRFNSLMKLLQNRNIKAVDPKNIFFEPLPSVLSISTRSLDPDLYYTQRPDGSWHYARTLPSALNLCLNWWLQLENRQVLPEEFSNFQLLGEVWFKERNKIKGTRGLPRGINFEPYLFRTNESFYNTYLVPLVTVGCFSPTDNTLWELWKKFSNAQEKMVTITPITDENGNDTASIKSAALFTLRLVFDLTNAEAAPYAIFSDQPTHPFPSSDINEAIVRKVAYMMKDYVKKNIYFTHTQYANQPLSCQVDQITIEEKEKSKRLPFKGPVFTVEDDGNFLVVYDNSDDCRKMYLPKVPNAFYPFVQWLEKHARFLPTFNHAFSLEAAGMPTQAMRIEKLEGVILHNTAYDVSRYSGMGSVELRGPGKGDYVFYHPSSSLPFSKPPLTATIHNDSCLDNKVSEQIFNMIRLYN